MRIRSRISITWYVLSRFQWASLLALALGTAALSSSLVALFSKAGFALLLAVFFVSLGIIARLVSIYQICTPSGTKLELELYPFFSEYAHSALSHISQVRIHQAESNLDFEMIRFCNGGLVIKSESIDDFLISDPIIEFVLRKKYERQVLKNLKMYWGDFRDFLVLQALLPARLFNERKIALISKLEPGQNVMLGYTTYLSSCVTNEACCYIIKRQGRIAKDFRPIFPLEWSCGAPIISPIETSSLSNHIGVCVLAKSSDGYLIPWLQNQHAQQNVGELVPTSAGSLDWTDIRKSKSRDLLGIIRYGMARELHEEAELQRSLENLGIKESAAHILVIGYFRWILRGGKPEFIGIGQIPVKYHDFSPQLSEVERVNPGDRISKYWYIRTVQDVLSFCDFYLDDPKNKAGIQLSAICHRLRSILSGNHEPKIKASIIDFWKLG